MCLAINSLSFTSLNPHVRKAMMFCSAWLPFHLAINPHFRKVFAYAANNSISGYQPIGHNKLRTTSLQNEQNRVEN